LILVKNRLIFGSIKKLITTVLKFIYKIISVFNLQAVLLVLLVGVVFYFTGAFEENPTVLVLFIVVLVAVFLLSISFGLKKLFRIGKKVKRNKGVDVVDPVPANGNGGTKTETANTQTASNVVGVANATTYPKYFTVKQNPKYVMAEYEDRYELFYRDSDGFKRRRVDYK